VRARLLALIAIDIVFGAILSQGFNGRYERCEGRGHRVFPLARGCAHPVSRPIKPGLQAQWERLIPANRFVKVIRHAQSAPIEANDFFVVFLRVQHFKLLSTGDEGSLTMTWLMFAQYHSDTHLMSGSAPNPTLAQKRLRRLGKNLMVPESRSFNTSVSFRCSRMRR
jgi:hypothetical protein